MSCRKSIRDNSEALGRLVAQPRPTVPLKAVPKMTIPKAVGIRADKLPSRNALDAGFVSHHIHQPA